MIDPDVVKRSSLIERWMTENIRKFNMIYPGIDEKELGSILLDIIQQKGTNSKTLLHNNYQRQEVSSTVLDMYDWVQNRKPIIAGGGTYFMNQRKAHSPIYTVIKRRKKDRKFYQHRRDTHPLGSYEWFHDEMMQGESKVKINAIYGSFGTPSFQFYNLYTAAATTLTSQMMIAATGIAIEAFMSDSPVYESIDDVLYFFDCVFSREEYKYNYSVLPVISDWRIVAERYISKMKVPSELKLIDIAIIERALKNCTEEQLTRLYYKNNLYAFLDTPLIHGILIDIFNTNTNFLNPNDIPPELQTYMDMLWNYAEEFVVWNHNWTERIRRLATQERRAVIGVDTDSNMVHLQPFVDYLETSIWYCAEYNTQTRQEKEFMSANIATALLTKMIRKLLDRHTEQCNVLPEEAADINMKNEFLWSRCLWTPVKKRYVTKVLIKEGKIIPEGSKIELDIKGFDFKKAAVNKSIADKLANIILIHIMRPEKINISNILRELDALEKEIIQSVTSGERDYCLRMSCKEPRAYARPESQGAVISVQLWNLIYPENPIQIPTKCDVVLLKGVKMNRLEPLRKDYPEQIQKIEKYIFDGPNKAYYAKHGLKYLALPNDGSRVPKMFLPLIDVNWTLTRNLGTFDSIMASLGVPMNELKRKNKCYKYYGNTLDV